MADDTGREGSDEVLAGLLAAAGVERPLVEVRALVAGIAAAARPRDLDPALGLIVPDPSPELAARLTALIDAQARRYDAAVARPGAGRERLAALRTELARRGLDGFVVPRADEHQGEYVPRRAERLAWLTGFTGSAGTATVLPGSAAIFVDGRYTLQVRDEVDADLFAPRHATDEPLEDWLADALRGGQRLGYDPWLHTLAGVEKLAAACRKAGAEIVACEGNPIDAVWPDQPPAPLGPVVPHDLAYAGVAAAEKRARAARTLAKTGAAAAVLTAPDSIAWLLNLRGADVPHTPLPLGFAILGETGAVDLFMDGRKLTPAAVRHLGDEVGLHPPATLDAALDRLGRTGSKVLLAAATAPFRIATRIEEAGGEVVRGDDPCALHKACKNPTELAGARAAHLRDGAALTRFLAWLAERAPRSEVDELAAAEKLRALRFEDERLCDLSFPSISAAGPNAAIVHYRADRASNRPLAPDTLYLVDSGGQYLDGTTDVTRTVAIGVPSGEQRDRFTRVLKGHIALARCRFPAGTTGSQLDSFARRALWQAGLDYDHGTGHGVGSFLSVHEGPQRISKTGGGQALEPGMILSNEPGYYKTGAWGIRIENLVVVVEARAPEGAEKPLLGFETLTRAPIDLNLVVPELMTEDEIAWLDDYHREVRRSLAPLLDPETAAWLAAATRPLGG